MCTNELNDLSFGFPGGIQGTKSGNKLKKTAKKFREIDFTEKKLTPSLLKISIKVMSFCEINITKNYAIKNCKQTADSLV